MNWLTIPEASALWQVPDSSRLKGKRDRAILALLLGCGLRRREVAELTLNHFQRREERWAVVYLAGKGGRIRTVPIPLWVKTEIDEWLLTAGVVHGRLFRCVCRSGKCGDWASRRRPSGTDVKRSAAVINLHRIAPHDLRRSCARLCHDAGGELEQIQFLLGHASVQTTERLYRL